MNLSQLLIALSARRKIIILTLLLTVLAATIISLVMPKTYIGVASVVVNSKGVDQITGSTIPAQMLAGYVATQADIITSTTVALKAVDALKLADSEKAKEQFNDDTNGQGSIRDWLADALLAKLTVDPGKDSSVLTISYKGRDPQFVANVANAFANAYLQLSVELKTQPAQQASNYINNQLKLLREQYETAQSRLSAYQKANNIFSADKQLDVETTRLNDLSTQVVQSQNAMLDANSRENQAEHNPDSSYDIQNSSLIQSLKSNLAAAEGKFADLQTRLAPNHPLYISAKSEVDRLRGQLNEQTNLASSGISSNAHAIQQRESQLQYALRIQKAKVLALNSLRDEFNVLTKEVENARLAYEVTTQRYTLTNLEGQSKQADVAIVAAATPPIKPHSPRLILNIAISIVVGLMLGVGAALALEIIDPRIRSAIQLTETFDLPVLGVIEKSLLAGSKRRKLVMSNSEKESSNPA